MISTQHHLRISFISEKTGSEDDFTYKPKHWEYEERELTQDEYSQYLIAMEQAKEINEHSDEEAIDNYTRQLMDEGVLEYENIS